MHKLYPKKFSIATPKKVTLAYLWIFNPIDGIATSSKRIISDTYDELTPVKNIVEAKGLIIPDVKNVKNMRKGRRREDWGGKDTNHGVNMVRMLAGDDYGAISKKKFTKMLMAQRKCSSSY